MLNELVGDDEVIKVRQSSSNGDFSEQQSMDQQMEDEEEQKESELMKVSEPITTQKTA
jgi:hypothetical protein